MTTLQELCDVATTYRRPVVSQEQVKFIQSRLFVKLSRIASYIGEPLIQCEPFTFKTMKEWFAKENLGYEITYDETSRVLLFFWIDGDEQHLILFDRPNNKRQLPFEWYSYDVKTSTLLECRHGLIRNSPDCGLFIEQMNRVYVCRGEQRWISKDRLYDIRIGHDLEVSKISTDIIIPLGVSYKEPTDATT